MFVKRILIRCPIKSENIRNLISLCSKQNTTTLKGIFEINQISNKTYLDYILDEEDVYDETYWGTSFLLSDKEEEIYSKLYAKMNIKANRSNLRKIVCSSYRNHREDIDYYEMEPITV